MLNEKVFNLKIFIGLNLQFFLHWLVVILSFILSFALSMDIAYAGQHYTKTAVIHLSREMLLKALIEEASLNWGNPSIFKDGFSPFIAEQLDVHVKSNLYHESVMQIALTQKWGKEVAALIPVKNILGCESFDLFPSYMTNNYTFAGFKEQLTHNIAKNFPIVAKIENNWYFFTFYGNLVSAIDLSEVSNELDSISNFYLNYNNDISQDFLKSARTLDNIHDVLQRWEIPHKNFKGDFILRIPAGDTLALLKKDDSLVPVVYDFKQNSDIDFYVSELNRIPHLTLVSGNYVDKKLAFCFIEGFSIVDRSTFNINNMSSISKFIDISEKEFFTDDLGKTINNLLDNESIIAADSINPKSADITKKLGTTLIKNVAKCLPPKFDL